MADNASSVKIEEIKIEVKANTKTAGKNLADFIEKLKELQKTTASLNFNGTVKFESLTRSIEKLSKIGKISIQKNLAENIIDLGAAADSLKGVDFSKVEEMAAAYKKLADVGTLKAPKFSGGKSGASAESEVGDKYSKTINKNSQTAEVTQKADNATDKYVQQVEKLNNAFARGDISGSKYLSRLKEISDKADNASKTSTVLSGAAGKVGNMFLKAGVAVAKFSLKVGTAPFRAIAKSLGNIVSRLKGFIASIKRVALYRAIRTALKEISQGFAEGKENLYQYSKAIDGQFAKSMDSLATSALYAKNSLGAMAAPLINRLAPVIDFIIDKFVDMLNIINQVIASLTGAATWTKALKYPTEYAESVDDATKAAKKLKATILGFDELNVLNDNSNNTGKSEADSLDYSKMFTEEEVSFSTKGWIDKIKKAWEKADFTEIGNNIGKSIKNGLDKIPWATIQAKVISASKSLGTMLNGLVETEELGETIGSSIAEAINTGVEGLSTFFDSVHWDSVGAFFGKGLNGFTKNFDSRGLGSSIAKAINSGVSLILGFVNTVNWSYIGTFFANGINGFFNTVNTANLGKVISNGIKGAILAVRTFLQQTDFNKVGEKIGEFFKSVDWTGILSGLAGLIKDAIKAALDVLKGLISTDPFFGSMVVVAIATKLGSLLTGYSPVSILRGKFSTLFSTALNDASNISATSSIGQACSTLGGAIGTAIGVAAAGMIGWHIGNWLYNNIPQVQSIADNLVEGTAGFFKDTIGSGNLKKAAETIIGTAKEVTFNPIENIKTLIRGYADGGAPQTGQLFLARESGPELVANIGNKTQVANNDQIMQSVSSGVELANAEQNIILKEQNELLRQILVKENTVVANVTTDSIISGISRKNRRDGIPIVSVG